MAHLPTLRDKPDMTDMQHQYCISKKNIHYAVVEKRRFWVKSKSVYARSVVVGDNEHLYVIYSVNDFFPLYAYSREHDKWWYSGLELKGRHYHNSVPTLKKAIPDAAPMEVTVMRVLVSLGSAAATAEVIRQAIDPPYPYKVSI